MLPRQFQRLRPERKLPSGHRPPDRQVRETLIRVGLPLLVSLMIATWLPSPLFLPAMEAFAFYAAMGMGLSAFWRREKLAESGRFNRWDSAMILMAVSMAFAVFVDEDAVLAFIEQAIDDQRAP